MALVGAPFFTQSGSRTGPFLKSQNLKNTSKKPQKTKNKKRNLKDKYLSICHEFVIRDNNKK